MSRNFRALEMVVAHLCNDWNPGHISIMTNLGADGNRLPLDHPAMLHRATTYDQTRNKRKLHRTTIAGKTPDRAFAVMPAPLTAY